MSRKCTLCNHPNRNDIENAILEGKVLKTIADQYGLTTVSIWRHRENHMKPESREAIQAAGQGLLPLNVAVSPDKAERMAQHLDAAVEMRRLYDEGWLVYEAARKESSLKYRLQAITVLQANIKLMADLSILAKLSGELDDSGSRRLSEALEDLVARTKEGVPA